MHLIVDSVKWNDTDTHKRHHVITVDGDEEMKALLIALMAAMHPSAVVR